MRAAVMPAVLAEGYPPAIEAALERVPVSANRCLRAAMTLAQPRLEAAHPRAWAALAG